MMKLKIAIIVLIFGLTGLPAAFAEVNRSQYAEDDIFITVLGEDWYPEGFEHGLSVPATYVKQADILLDGIDDEPAWAAAAEVQVPLEFGSTGKALVKALYTDDKLHIRVRWADSTEDRQHHPWVWDAEQQKYVAGPQVEDSVMLSIEAGCNWNASLLAGYQYDFDGWRWLAARSDPVGQAWDLMGNIADQDHALLKPTPYKSRNTENVWNVKFGDYDGETEISHLPWKELDRYYLYRPVRPMSWYRAEIDGMRVTEIGDQLPAPQAPPEDHDQAFPQFKAVKLEGDAGEVGAKGHWEDGYWTVEFSRNLITPSNTLTDSVFTRLTQFSIHVFDQTERLDQTSESDRLFLEFLPEEQRVAKD
jgi:hypothetical protein